MLSINRKTVCQHNNSKTTTTYEANSCNHTNCKSTLKCQHKFSAYRMARTKGCLLAHTKTIKKTTQNVCVHIYYLWRMWGKQSWVAKGAFDLLFSIKLANYPALARKQWVSGILDRPKTAFYVDICFAFCMRFTAASKNFTTEHKSWKSCFGSPSQLGEQHVEPHRN